MFVDTGTSTIKNVQHSIPARPVKVCCFFSDPWMRGTEKSTISYTAKVVRWRLFSVDLHSKPERKVLRWSGLAVTRPGPPVCSIRWTYLPSTYRQPQVHLRMRNPRRHPLACGDRCHHTFIVMAGGLHCESLPPDYTRTPWSTALLENS